MILPSVWRACATALILSTAAGACATTRERAAFDLVDAFPTTGVVPRAADGAPAPPPEPIADFAALVRVAAERSPALVAAYEDARAAALMIPATRKLPEPMVSLTGFLLPLEPSGGHPVFQLGASQSFPWPTKLDRAADAQAGTVAVSRRRFEALHRALVRDLRVPWAELAATTAAHAVVVAQVDVVGRVSASVEARVAVGDAHISALSQLALRQERLREQALDLTDRAALLREALRARAGLPTDTPLPEPTLPKTLAAPPSADAIVQAAKHSPTVATADAAIGAAEAAVGAAETAGLPDFTVGLAWTFVDEARMPGTDTPDQDVVAATIGVSIPLWGGAYTAMADAARARVRAAGARSDEARQTAEVQLREWAVALATANRQVAAYEGDLARAAEGALWSTLEAYSVEHASLQDVLAMEEELLTLKLSALAARASSAVLAAKIAFHTDATSTEASP